MTFGKVSGRFFLTPHLGITDDGDIDTYTLSELIETYKYWHTWHPPGIKKLFTMFATSSVHHEVIDAMEHFDEVWVPFPYLRDVLVREGLKTPVHVLGRYSSPLIDGGFVPKEKERDPESTKFLYVGTNDARKNVKQLIKAFLEARSHKPRDQLIVKTNVIDGLPSHPKVNIICGHISLEKLAVLYNVTDFFITFSRGEGVCLPALEAAYFNKPIIATVGGALVNNREYLGNTTWHVLPHDEEDISYRGVPYYLHNVFWGTWWTPNYDQAVNLIKGL